MKALKILLALAVVAVISFFAWRWLVKIDDTDPITGVENQFVKRIEKDIDSLREVPTNSFCSEFYRKIQYDIDEFHEKGFLGETTSINDQKEEHLKKNVYAVYSSKFTEQAMFVFNGNEWKTDDLKFIRNENKRLQKSEFLKEGPQKVSFMEIDTILAKYDTIVGFIEECDKFGAPDDELLSEFPDASKNVSKANGYLKNKLGNKYVNNCSRLKNSLKDVSETLFNKHKSFLSNKINKYGSQFNDYNNQKEWNDMVYNPIKEQIDKISGVSYNLKSSYVESVKNELYGLLDKYGDEAYEHYKNTNQQNIGM